MNNTEQNQFYLLYTSDFGLMYGMKLSKTSSCSADFERQSFRRYKRTIFYNVDLDKRAIPVAIAEMTIW